MSRLNTKKIAEVFNKYSAEYPVLQSVPYWAAATLVGLIAVGYAETFEYFTTAVKEVHATYPYLLILSSPICFLFGWLLVDRIAPNAGGSGIPQVKAAINLTASSPWRVCQLLTSLKIGAIKMVSSLFIVLGGGAIGREGPTIQIAASVFYYVGRKFKKLGISGGHQPWIIAGGAAGIAAAFNTPLGGIVFAIEELAPQHFNRFKTVLISAVIVAGMVTQWVWGTYLYFEIPRIQNAPISYVPWALSLGILCGLAGGFMGKLLLRLGDEVSKLNPRRRLYAVLGCGMGVAIISLITGASVLGGGADVVRELFMNEEPASFSLIVGRYLTTCLSYLSGAAGGIFAPSLALGAAIGSKFDVLVQSGNANLMVLMGMAAFLSAVTRAPFTALVLVFEMTDRHSAIFFLMVASMTGYLVGHLIDKKSFYDRLAERYLARANQEQEPA